MFTKGQKVVCIDGVFPREVRSVYSEIPITGGQYTIRAVYMGRGNLRGAPEAASPELGVLLEEVHNSTDCSLAPGLKGELGFNAERFAPLQTLPPAEKQKEFIDAQPAFA